jgi:hypothetical protein
VARGDAADAGRAVEPPEEAEARMTSDRAQVADLEVGEEPEQVAVSPAPRMYSRMYDDRNPPPPPGEWPDTVRQSVLDAGGSEDAADAASFLVEVSPVGTFVDVYTGFEAMAGAIRDGDVEALAIAAGELGLEASKLDRVKEVVAAASGKARGAIADAVPDVMADWMVKRMGAVDFPGETAREGIARALKNGFDPGDALAYGVFSANAKNAINTAAESVLGKGKQLTEAALAKLSPTDQARLRDVFTSELAQMGGEYLTDVRQEAQSRMVGMVARELFGPDEAR